MGLWKVEVRDMYTDKSKSTCLAFIDIPNYDEAMQIRDNVDVQNFLRLKLRGTSNLITLHEIQRVKENSLIDHDNIKEISMSSTKSSIGHLLGAAGAVEAIFCILAVHNNIVPPTLNLVSPCRDPLPLDLIAHEAKEKKVTKALSNSFGFGGTNASLVVGKFE